jgi:lysophospholipase L1-like esterase
VRSSLWRVAPLLRRRPGFLVGAALAMGLAALVFVGCADVPSMSADEPEPSIYAPARGTMAGYYSVVIALEGVATAQDVEWASFGGIPAYGLRPTDAGALEVWVQGHPSSGAVTVQLGVGEVIHTLSEPFHYDASRLFGVATMHAIGASLTQGTQRGLPTQGSVLRGPAAQLARQLGLYFPLPLLIEEGFQEMTPELIGPPPYCLPPELDAYQMDQALLLIPQLTDPETDAFSFTRVRVTPHLEAHNLAVGGSRVGEVLDGPADGDIALEFLSHMVYEPVATIGDPVTQSQLEVLVAAQPELVISFDLLGNDLIDGMIDNGDFKLNGMTPVETFLADIDRAVALLAATQAQVFLANLPNPTDLPFFRAKRARLAEQGLTENAERVFAAIDEGVLAGNARLSLQADAHHNVHVVDVAGMVSRWVTDGVRVDDATLWVQQYGGLIGLDGLHFSDTAYALVANAMLDRLSEVFDVALAPIDVGQVWRQDRERPEALSEDGLEASACQGDLASP